MREDLLDGFFLLCFRGFRIVLFATYAIELVDLIQVDLKIVKSFFRAK